MPNFWQNLPKPSTFLRRNKFDEKSGLDIQPTASEKNFWKVLGKPFFCLAPMEEVTDFAFREMFAQYSKSEKSENRINRKARLQALSDFSDSADLSDSSGFVMFTEFLNVDGLLHPEGFEKLKIDLKYSEAQRPIVAQIWGREPEKFFRAAQLIASLGFDGVDINMGCPQSKEIAGGTCAALIREPKLAQEIIAAVKEGAVRRNLSPALPSSNFAKSSSDLWEGEGEKLPVSVKTRLGYSKVEEMEGWVRNILEMDIAALTLHGRTKQEMTKVPAHWDKIAEAVGIRDEMFPVNPHPAQLFDAKKSGHLPPEGEGRTERTLIIGNGDIKSRQEGLARIQETKVDGVMVARGAFGNPWFFAQPNQYTKEGVRRSLGEGGSADGNRPDIKERLRVMLEHAELFDRTFAGLKSFAIMRKHFKAYCSGFPGAHELRAKLMETKNLSETKNIVEEYFKLNQI